MDLYQAALRYVARYATSKEHLRRVLRRRLARAARLDPLAAPAPNVAEAAIAAVISRLERIGAVDDDAFAAAQVRMLRAQGRSSRAIRARLAAKGVSASAVEPLLAAEDRAADPSAYPADNPTAAERSAARRYARRRRLGPFRSGTASGPEQRQKDLAALCRAGFAYDTALAVIDSPADPVG
jgi:regulatory protein